MRQTNPGAEANLAAFQARRALESGGVGLAPRQREHGALARDDADLAQRVLRYDDTVNGFKKAIVKLVEGERIDVYEGI